MELSAVMNAVGGDHPPYGLRIRDYMANARCFYTLLIESLTNLAGSAEDQIKYIERLGLSPSADELALEFDTAFVLLETFVQEKFISAGLADKIKEVDRKLEFISGKDHLWDFKALRESTEWQEIRVSAKRALDAMMGDVRL